MGTLRIRDIDTNETTNIDHQWDYHRALDTIEAHLECYRKKLMVSRPETAKHIVFTHFNHTSDHGIMVEWHDVEPQNLTPITKPEGRYLRPDDHTMKLLIDDKEYPIVADE